MLFGRRTWAFLLGGSLAVAVPIACSSEASGPKDQNGGTDAGSGYTGPEGGGFETKTDTADATGEAADKSASDGGADAASDAAGGDGAGGDAGAGG